MASNFDFSSFTVSNISKNLFFFTFCFGNGRPRAGLPNKPFFGFNQGGVLLKNVSDDMVPFKRQECVFTNPFTHFKHKYFLPDVNYIFKVI